MSTPTKKKTAQKIESSENDLTEEKVTEDQELMGDDSDSSVSSESEDEELA